MKKETIKIIDETIEQMTLQNNGELMILTNLEQIARRAEISDEEMQEYIRQSWLHENINDDM